MCCFFSLIIVGGASLLFVHDSFEAISFSWGFLRLASGSVALLRLDRLLLLDELFLLRLLLTTFLLFKVEVIVKDLFRLGREARPFSCGATNHYVCIICEALPKSRRLLAGNNRGWLALKLVFDDLELLAYCLLEFLPVVRLFVVTLFNRLLHQER